MQVRPYQREAIGAVLKEYDRGVRSTMIVMPTGTGKSFTFAQIAKAMAHLGTVVVLAHRRELVTQAARTIESVAGLGVEIEMSESRAGGLFLPPVVCASVDSISRPRRLAEYPSQGVGLIIADECHHSVAAGWRRVFEHFPRARILGCTATADRADGIGLRNVFESCAYTYEIRDAIEQGFLVPIRQRAIDVAGLDLSTLKVTRRGDFKDEDIEDLMRQDEVLHEVASPLVELAGKRSTVVFCAGVAHAHELARVLRGYNVTAAAVDGTTPDDERERILADLHEGRLQFVTNCAVLTEGWDCPPVSCIAMARPTSSRALYAQCLGRGLRLHPGKTDCLALDFVGNAGKHSLVTALDVLDGSDLDEATKRRAQQKADEGMALHDAIDQAAREIADEQRRLMVRARFNVRDVDPFQLLGAPNRRGRWGGVPATDAQLAVLERAGVKAKGLDKGQASALITEIIRRRDEGLCTYKQALRLRQFGLNPDVPMPAASEALDAIAATGWKSAPDWLLDDPRFRVAEGEAA